MTAPPEITIRKALVSDIPVIGKIINKQAETGTMLQRPLSILYENVRDYSVIELNGEIIGCGAFHVIWSDLAEICSVTVVEDFRRRGYGRALVETLMEEAEMLHIERIFILTYQVDFFRSLGFSEIDKSKLPHKIWRDCLNCVHFPDCDEVSMIRIVA